MSNMACIHESVLQFEGAVAPGDMGAVLPDHQETQDQSS